MVNENNVDVNVLQRCFRRRQPNGPRVAGDCGTRECEPLPSFERVSGVTKIKRPSALPRGTHNSKKEHNEVHTNL